METQWFLQLSLWCIFLAASGVTGWHRYQSIKDGEKLSRRDEGKILFWAIRLAGIPMFLATLAQLLAPHRLAWARLELPDGLRWLGVALGVFALWFLYWTLSSLGKNLTDTVVTRQKHTLVTSGPYRWIRHPFYTSLVLLVASTSLVAANWLMAATGLLVFWLLAVRVPIEERKLVERFGDDYRVYARQTGRYLPFVGKRKVATPQSESQP